MSKIWIVEEVNNEYEYRNIKIICDSKELAEQKQEEYAEQEHILYTNRVSHGMSSFYIREWELNKEKND